MAPNKQIKTFDSWIEFKSSLSSFLPDLRYETYLFRGQGDSGWPLVSSLDREFSFKTNKKRDVLFAELLRIFSDQLEREQPELFSDDSHRIAALAQHYGAPTRLLDWTRSPYIAAFFAFAAALRASQGHQPSKIAVWVLALNELQAKKGVAKKPATKHNGQILWEDANVEIVQVKDPTNERLRNQDGLFTFLKSEHLSLDDYFWHVAKLKPCLLKIEVPADQARKALEDLLMMGISPKKIYPGIEGLAQYAFVRMVLGLVS